MPNSLSFSYITPEIVRQLQTLFPPNISEPSYKVIAKELIPSVFPDSFRAKFDHAVVMKSGDASGMAYLIINAQRVDPKASAIDQEQFGIVFNNGVPSQSGVFIHHGGWQGRTETVKQPQFWNHVTKSGIGNYYPPPSLPPNSSGSLHDLESTSNLNAFNQTLKVMVDYL